MATQLKAAAYLRVSTKEQNEDTQLPDIMKQAKNDSAELITEFIFRDRISGLKDEKNRAGLNDLLKLTAKDVDIVYIWEISRLSRKPSDFLKLVESIKSKGINICFLKPAPIYLLDKITGEENLATSLMLSMFSNFASFEIKQKTQRTQRGRNEAIFTRNETYANNVPFGYKKENKNLVVDKDTISNIEGFTTTSETVKSIYKMYNDGVSPVNIARKLNEYGIQTNYNKIVKKDSIEYQSGITIPKENLIWRRQTVFGILNNTVYAGYKTVNTNVKTDRMDENKKPVINHTEKEISTPAIIDENVFLSAQQTKRLNITKASKSKKTEYLLRGLLRCGLCGDYYVGTSNINETVYRCADVVKRNNATYKGCKGCTICSYRLDYMVWESIRTEYKVISFEDNQNKGRDEMKGKIENNQQLIALKEKIIREKGRMFDELTNMILNTSSKRMKESYTGQQNELDKELNVLEIELKDLKIKEATLLKELEQINKAIEDYNSGYTERIIKNISEYDISDIEGSFAMKKDAIKRVVKEIVLYKAKENGTINKRTYKSYRKLFIIHISLFNGADIFIMYNAYGNGTFVRMFSLDSEHTLDKEKLVFKMQKFESLDKNKIKEVMPDWYLKELGEAGMDLLYDIKHPAELYNGGTKYEIPERTKSK